MVFQISDKLLWLCIGGSLYLAAHLITTELHRVKGFAEIKKKEEEEHLIGQATEDALKLETLAKLSESSSFDLRAALVPQYFTNHEMDDIDSLFSHRRSLKIVSERASKEPTRDLLLEDLASKDRGRRQKALTAIHFLVANPSLGRSSSTARLRDTATFNALIDCLCNFLQEHTERNVKIVSPISPQTRPVGEAKALKVLSILLVGNISPALEAGIISRWLTNYPFPLALKDKSKKRNVISVAKLYWSDDPVMSSILSTLSSDQDALRQLRKFELMGSRMEEHTSDEDPFAAIKHQISSIANHDYDDDDESDVWMLDEEDTPGLPTWLVGRRQANTAEEQALRRRRREAMVFSEGGQPVAQDNIFHPINPPETLDEEWGRENESDEANPSWDVNAEPVEPETGSSQWRLWPF
ncbi:hypothetical protein FQN57_005756 [Myotisia sp. PD_48]|nr:hypothetical protein FQN57_005756 [Myotisia sp. PD_48]